MLCVIFIRCDSDTSNNKHKKQSQNDIQYKAEKNENYYRLDTAAAKKRFLTQISGIFRQLVWMSSSSQTDTVPSKWKLMVFVALRLKKVNAAHTLFPRIGFRS